MSDSRMTLDEILSDLQEESRRVDEFFVDTEYSPRSGKAVLPPTSPGSNYLRNVELDDLAPSAANRPSVAALSRNPGGDADGAIDIKFYAQRSKPPAARPVTMDPFARLPHKSVTGAELDREIADLNILIDASQRTSVADSRIQREQQSPAAKTAYSSHLNERVTMKLSAPNPSPPAVVAYPLIITPATPVAMPLVIEEVPTPVAPSPVSNPSWIAKLNDIIREQPLGMGIYGESTKGRWEPLFNKQSRAVVVKKWKCQDLSKNFLKLFDHNTRKLQNLEPHPNLAVVIAGCTNEELATLYDYVHGRSVADVIKTNPSLLTPETVVKVAKQVADAIGHLHDNGVAHESLRPTNVIVDASFNVKVTDYGFEFIKEQIRANGMLMAPEYSAPEALQGQAKLSEKVDQYAYGILLNHMLSRQAPFQGMVPRMIITGVVTDALRPSLAPGCSYPLKRLIEACWMQDPLKRPAFSVIQTLIHQPVTKLL